MLEEPDVDMDSVALAEEQPRRVAFPPEVVVRPVVHPRRQRALVRLPRANVRDDVNVGVLPIISGMTILVMFFLINGIQSQEKTYQSSPT